MQCGLACQRRFRPDGGFKPPCTQTGARQGANQPTPPAQPPPPFLQQAFSTAAPAASTRPAFSHTPAGRNHLFVPGPVNIHESVLRAMQVPGQNHRDPWFAEFYKKCLEVGLQRGVWLAAACACLGLHMRCGCTAGRVEPRCGWGDLQPLHNRMGGLHSSPLQQPPTTCRLHGVTLQENTRPAKHLHLAANRTSR